jgi:hypothetical protein
MLKTTAHTLSAMINMKFMYTPSEKADMLTLALKYIWCAVAQAGADGEPAPRGELLPGARARFVHVVPRQHRRSVPAAARLAFKAIPTAAAATTTTTTTTATTTTTNSPRVTQLVDVTESLPKNVHERTLTIHRIAHQCKEAFALGARNYFMPGAR